MSTEIAAPKFKPGMRVVTKDGHVDTIIAVHWGTISTACYLENWTGLVPETALTEVEQPIDEKEAERLFNSYYQAANNHKHWGYGDQYKYPFQQLFKDFKRRGVAL